MKKQHIMHNILVIWRGKKLNVEINSDATLKEIGVKLQKLFKVKADTIRLLVPQYCDKSSRMLSPFSDEHSSLSLQQTFILESKSIRMMGVFEEEIDEVIQNAKTDLRIAGFDEEERLRQQMLDRLQSSLKLPEGPYIFCDFRTLHIPGIELTPPASEALKRMHTLAADPGIIAIMNKHRWRVGIMTEMAPVGYVGISPKCPLGYNMNHGEEISLRLRTDDLKGFRKYESIKKTLLHELAHMVYSEHDTDFYTLDRQLNQEAASLDWTKSRGRTLSGTRYSEHYEAESYIGTSSSSPQKLGGNASDQLASARASSVAAAYHRLASASKAHAEPDPDDSGFKVIEEPDPYDAVGKEDMLIENSQKADGNLDCEPDPDDYLDNPNKFEPDSDDSMETEPYSGTNGNQINFEPDPGDSEMTQHVSHSSTDKKLVSPRDSEELDLNGSKVALEYAVMIEPSPKDSQAFENVDSENQPRKSRKEPDPDDSMVKQIILDFGNSAEPDPDDSREIGAVEEQTTLSKSSEPIPDDSEVKGVLLEDRNHSEPYPDHSEGNEIMEAEFDPADNHAGSLGTSGMQANEPDPDDQELQRIQDPVTVYCTRLQNAIEMLQSEVNHSEAASILQTLFKIIRNVIEHPDEIKFKRLRKANPLVQRNVAKYKAAMEVLLLVGFKEDIVPDEIGRAETYLVLKRNDPGLLWLAKSSLEMCIV